MYRSFMLAALLGALVSGCAIGPVPSGYPPALGPAGAQLRLQVGRVFVVGELLAVEDTTLLLAVNAVGTPGGDSTAPLVRVPLRSIKTTAGLFHITGRWRDEDRYRYRPISRYPAGVPPELEHRLLAAFGADSVRWVQP